MEGRCAGGNCPPAGPERTPCRIPSSLTSEWDRPTLGAVFDRVDFSRNVAVYDRRHGAFLDAEAARELARLAALGPDSRVLELGAGTGRVAVPLARTGACVMGLDVSHSML